MINYSDAIEFLLIPLNVQKKTCINIRCNYLFNAAIVNYIEYRHFMYKGDVDLQGVLCTQSLYVNSIEAGTLKIDEFMYRYVHRMCQMRTSKALYLTSILRSPRWKRVISPCSYSCHTVSNQLIFTFTSKSVILLTILFIISFQFRPNVEINQTHMHGTGNFWVRLGKQIILLVY